MHRLSYWKSTVLSFLVAVLACSSALGLAWLVAPTIAVTAIQFLLVSVFAASTAVACGGLTCLWRDSRESAGKPDLFARYADAAPKPGILSRAGLRFLLGSRARPGDLVQVRSLEEIRATLDSDGTLDGLPFMPEMEEFCGRRLLVHRRVDKINDMRHKTGLRRMRDTVTLTGTRCSGSDHGGCQAECQLLWKDAWISRLPARPHGVPAEDGTPRAGPPQVDEYSDNGEKSYFCQMTRLWEASHWMSPFDIRQDLRPVLSGNLRIAPYLLAMLTRIFNHAQRIRGGVAYPFMPDSTGKGSTPSADLQLSGGETILVRSKDEIAGTLVDSRNRGLWFDREMIRYCRQSAVVRRRVSRVIHEGTGNMVVMKTPCIVLENVTATGEFLRLCPQHEYIFWREIWLRRRSRDSRDASTNDSGNRA